MLRMVASSRDILIQVETTYSRGSSSALEFDVAHILEIHF